jgi:hypothetical protein
MITANYRTMPALIQSLTAFKHGSCHAYWEYESDDSQQVYVVYSYGTRIAVAQRQPNGQLIASMDTQKYSTTTSRLQNIIKRAWAL